MQQTIQEKAEPAIKGWHIFLVVGTVALLLLFYQGLWGDPKMIPTVLIGTEAPQFSGPELGTSKTLGSGNYQGKVLVLNFWASWCEECKLEHQNLLSIDARFRSDPNFAMLGVDYQDKESDAQRYLEVFGSSFKHIRDPDGVISIDFGVYGVPETFVIDQNGIIRHKIIGPVMGTNYTHLVENVIQSLLQAQGQTS